MRTVRADKRLVDGRVVDFYGTGAPGAAISSMSMRWGQAWLGTRASAATIPPPRDAYSGFETLNGAAGFFCSDFRAMRER